jgi:hypothetical protein
MYDNQPQSIATFQDNILAKSVAIIPVTFQHVCSSIWHHDPIHEQDGHPSEYLVVLRLGKIVHA